VTGNALPADVDSFIARGADAVLLKPLDVDVLKRYISDTRRRVYKY
jgi:ABC-type sugar transport system substrate-binding protein